MLNISPTRRSRRRPGAQLQAAIPLLALFLTFILSSSTWAKDEDIYTATGLRWPTDASRRITSTFGEPRPDRFHAAIDFSTGGGVGFPCYAIDDGSIIRVKTNFNGYGKVLYLQIAGERVAVYGHLSRFNEKIEKRVREAQLKAGKYEVELFFKPGEIPFKKGQTVAYTGDTGAGPAHLHFELRKGLGVPYNPTVDGFIVKDTKAPVIRRIAVKALDGASEAEGDMLPVIRRMRNRTGTTVDIYGRVGISAEVVDFQDGGWHRLGPRRIELYLDGRLIHVTDLTRFNYRNNRDSRLDFDFELQKLGYKRFRRLYIVPGNDLSFYDRGLPGGLLDTKAMTPGFHELRVRAVDDSGNESDARLKLNVLTGPTLPPAVASVPMPPIPRNAVTDSTLNIAVRILGETARICVTGVPEGTENVWVRIPQFGNAFDLVDHGRNGWIGRIDIPLTFRGWTEFEVVAESAVGAVMASTDIRLAGFLAGLNDRWSMPDDRFEVRIAPGALWYDLVMGMTRRPRSEETIAEQIQLHPFDYPFERPFWVAFHSGDEPWDPRAVIVYREWSTGGRWTYLGNEHEMNGFVLKAESYSNETFSVTLDTLAPQILGVSYSDDGTSSTRRPLLAAEVIDELSGLDLEKCRLELDGQNTIWVYDPDKDTISYRPWSDLKRGRHSWRLVAVDKVGNETVMERTLRVR
ncbi:MAG: M23 family metallopeptidase [bacterium]